MKLKENIKSQNGYALLITLLTLMLLTVLGLSLMAMAMNTSKITKSERDSQSSYYIAEAGLVEKRAQINEIARQVYSTLREEYIRIGDPMLMKNFEFEKEFNSRVQKSVLDTLGEEEEDRTYSEQYAASPTSSVSVEIPDDANQLKFLIKSTGKVPSNNGSIKEKVVSQTVEIQVPDPTSTDMIEIPGENTVHKFNACFAVYASDYIHHNGGSVKGDIFTPGNIDITNGSITGNVFAGGYIKNSRNIVGNLVAGQHIDITAGTVTGNVDAGGYIKSAGNIVGNLIARQQIEITNGSVTGDLHAGSYIQSSKDIKGDLIARQQIEITNGSVTGDLHAGSNIKSSKDIKGDLVAGQKIEITNGNITGDVYGDVVTISNGSVNNSIVSQSDINITGGTVKKDIVSNRNINIENWPSINGNAIAKNNISAKESRFSGVGGKYLYGNEISVQNVNSSKKEKRTDISNLISNYPIPKNLANSDLSQSVINDNQCIANTLSLPNIDSSFPTTDSRLKKESPLVIKGGTNGKLPLNSDMYFSEIEIDNNRKLTIDLKNQHRKIYVDKFNNIQGHIELINEGSLEIIVQNSFYSKGQINIDGETENLVIRYAGSGDVNLTGESAINGSFYIKHAPKLTIAHISNSGIRGDLIIFGETAVEFGGGSSVTENLILAPLSTLTLTGGAKVKGNVIVKSFLNNEGHVTPPLQNSGEWEVPGSPAETIEIPNYSEETDFLITDPLKQE